MDHKYISTALFVCTAVVIAAISGCGTDKNSASVTERVITVQKLSVELPVSPEEKFGGIRFECSPEAFTELGFEPGDTVDIEFDNGVKLEQLPFLSGFYVKRGNNLLIAYPGYDVIQLQQNCGSNIWKDFGLTEGAKAVITLCKKCGCYDIETSFKLIYTDDREDYSTDAQFANFREVTVGDIRPGRLYRSASPCDNSHSRAAYSDRLASENGVKFIIDLADNDTEIAEYMSAPDFNSPHFRELYGNGRVAAINLSADYGSDVYKEKLGKGFTAYLDSDGALLIHCTEGKDRTGFVLAMLEALCGATLDEMKADYMLTFNNYYGVSRDKDAVQYDLIVSTLFDCFIELLNENAGSTDLKLCAEKYLLSCGLTEVQIDRLRERLTS